MVDSKIILQRNDIILYRYTNGEYRWFKNDKIHNDNDEPAIINQNYKKWYQNGKLHRDNDKPAIISKCGLQEWYTNGHLHRDNDKPAVINIDGTGLEQITFNETFDGFPMFTRDGKKLIFASNRFNKKEGDTNIFTADWVEQ